ncbi:NTP transferase domain-containing protein [soil metagenome]
MAESKSTRLESIVLAAGAGRRFGGRKLLASFEGRPLIVSALDAAFAAPVGKVWLTTDGDPELTTVAHDHARTLGREDDLAVVFVKDAAEGMGASLRTAVAALPAETAAAFVFLGDMPRIPAGLAQSLVDALAAGFDLVAPRFGGQRGHPVLFGRVCFPALLGLKGDAGARDLLSRAGERLALVDSPDAGVLFDVDRPVDLA